MANHEEKFSMFLREIVGGNNSKKPIPKQSPKQATNKKEKPAIAVDYSEMGVLVHGRYGWYNVLAGHHIYIKYQTEDENENYTWILEIAPSQKDNESENIYVELSHEEFCSARDIYKKLTAKKLTAKLSDEALRTLQEYLFTRTHFQKARKINRYGYDAESGMFFFSNCAVRNGKYYTPNEFAMIETGTHAYSMPEKEKKNTSFFQYKKSEINFNTFYLLFEEIHTTEIAFLSVSFYLMSLFRDVVLKHTKCSPILLLKGGAGTGKSSIARAISALFGNTPKANLKNRNTEPALVKLMSQASNCVIWFDEFHNDITCEGLLQSAYDNDGYHRSSDSFTSKTNSVDIYSALMLTSNYVPENPVFFSRCLFVSVPTPQKTETQRLKFEQLERHIDAGISSITADILQHRKLIETEFDKFYDKINATLKQLAKEKQENIDERFFTNMSAALTPITILACHDAVHICEYTGEDIEDYVCGIGSKHLIKQYRMMSETSALAKFFELLNIMHERYIVHEGIHFKIGTNEHTGKIAVRFGKIYTLFSEQYRKTYFSPPPSKHDIRNELMNLLEMKEWKEGRAKLFNSVGDQEKESTNVIWLDYEKIQKHFELELHKRRTPKNI